MTRKQARRRKQKKAQPFKLPKIRLSRIVAPVLAVAAVVATYFASASMLDSLSRKSHLLLDARAAERIMEPWGHSYDEERAEEQRERLERQRQQSIERAKELRAQAEEEERKAREDSRARIR